MFWRRPRRRSWCRTPGVGVVFEGRLPHCLPVFFGRTMGKCHFSKKKTTIWWKADVFWIVGEAFSNARFQKTTDAAEIAGFKGPNGFKRWSPSPVIQWDIMGWNKPETRRNWPIFKANRFGIYIKARFSSLFSNLVPARQIPAVGWNHPPRIFGHVLPNELWRVFILFSSALMISWSSSYYAKIMPTTKTITLITLLSMWQWFVGYWLLTFICSWIVSPFFLVRTPIFWGWPTPISPFPPVF